MITSGVGSVVPTADAIAAEVEEYLASFGDEDGQGRGRVDGPTDPEGPTDPRPPASPED
jgi:hypothetical protein